MSPRSSVKSADRVAAGKVLLAWMTPSEREAYLSRVELQPVTPKTIRSLARLRRELEKIRQFVATPMTIVVSARNSASLA